MVSRSQVPRVYADRLVGGRARVPDLPELARALPPCASGASETFPRHQTSKSTWPTSSGISREDAFYLFDNDVAETVRDLDARLPWWRRLSAARQRVLLNMCFNLGIGGLLEFRRSLAAMERGDFETAARQMKASKWATQVGDRADRLTALMRSG